MAGVVKNRVSRIVGFDFCRTGISRVRVDPRSATGVFIARNKAIAYTSQMQPDTLRIDGSYFNVMGLPIQRLYTELKRIERL